MQFRLRFFLIFGLFLDPIHDVLLRKYEYFVKGYSSSHKLKRQAHQIQIQVGNNEAPTFADHAVRTVQCFRPRKKTNVDFNQDSRFCSGIVL
jgi:hypothetical protein